MYDEIFKNDSTLLAHWYKTLNRTDCPLLLHENHPCFTRSRFFKSNSGLKNQREKVNDLSCHDDQLSEMIR